MSSPAAANGRPDEAGDNNLYIDHVEWKGTSCWPSQYKLVTEKAGGQYRHYFGLWRNGSFSIDLDVDPGCVARELADG